MLGGVRQQEAVPPRQQARRRGRVRIRPGSIRQVEQRSPVVGMQRHDLVAQRRDGIAPHADAALPATDVGREIIDARRSERSQVAPGEVDPRLRLVEVRLVDAEPVRGERIAAAAVPLPVMRHVDQRHRGGEVPPRGADHDPRVRVAPGGTGRGSRLVPDLGGHQPVELER
jgi:hypothetical protein